MDRSVAKFREGMASGVVETKLTIRNVVEQLDTQLAEPVEESQYHLPITNIPADFSAADKARLSAAYRRSITTEIRPALTRMRDFLRDEYLPVAREQVGLASMKGGPALYERLIESTTTLPLKADDIHRLGLSEVERIKGEMIATMRETGFTGTLARLLRIHPNGPALQAEEPREPDGGLLPHWQNRWTRNYPRCSRRLPKAGLEIRPYEPFREKFEAGGSYQSGTPDGSRPGVFYFNAYDLPSRTTPGERPRCTCTKARQGTISRSA